MVHYTFSHLGPYFVTPFEADLSDLLGCTSDLIQTHAFPSNVLYLHFFTAKIQFAIASYIKGISKRSP